jgi:LPS sulfotransferase NodH
MLEKPSSRFVIFSSPRSGSNLLCGMLNSHPEIICHHEVFHPHAIYYALDHRDGDIDLGTITERERQPEQFISRLWQQNFGCIAVGFKIMPGHNPQAFELLINDKNIKKIVLKRRNLLKAYVSSRIARQTKVWSNLKANNRTEESQKIAIEIDNLFSWFQAKKKYYQSLFQKLNDANQPFLELTYEDLAGSNSEAIKLKLMEFVGVSVDLSLLQIAHQKQNSNNLADLVANFAELKSQLYGTELEPLLDSLD